MKGKLTSMLMILLFAVPVTFISAQKYEFEYQFKEQEDPLGSVDKHFLGNQIATKMSLLKENYTYTVQSEISQASSTEVEKPAIYNSVYKVNKYVKKSMKKGLMTEEQAKTTMDKVLDVAINIRYQETDELEQELWKAKDPVVIASLFQEEIVLN